MAKTIVWTTPYSTPVVTPSLQAGGSLALGTTYYYRVVAAKFGGAGSGQNQVESPASVECSATPAGANQTIRLTWPQIANANYYWVHRSTTSGTYAASSVIAKVADGGAGGTTWDDDGSGSLGVTYATFRCTDLPLGFDHTIGRGSLTITGGTTGDPITFNDIYTAIGDDAFCKYIDDSIFGLLGYWRQNSEAAETHFEDTLKTIYLLGETRFDFIHADSEIIFGDYDSTYDYSSGGCVFYNCAPYRNDFVLGAGCHLYGCQFLSYYKNENFIDGYSIYGDRIALIDFEEMRDCLVSGFSSVLIYAGIGPLLNFVVETSYLYPITGVDLSNADGVTIKGGYLYIYYGDQDRLISFKIYAKTAYDIYIYSGFSTPDDKSVTMINPYFNGRTGNVPVIHWQNFVDDGYGFVDIYYEFDLTILDMNGNAISGAVVKIEDTSGTEIINTTTDANGQITTEEIKAARYTHKVGSGNGSGDTYTDTDAQGPFNLWVSQPGYQTRFMEFSLTAKTDWTISLRHGPMAGREAMGPTWR